MTALEQQLLDTIQDAFPLEERPYQVLADMLNAQGSAGELSCGSLTEQQVFDAVEKLRQSGIIRRIGGIYDSKKLGFISRLCAGKVVDVDKYAAVVNEIPAITHNYVRSHDYNVWFTVIAENEVDVSRIVDVVCSRTDLHDVHILSVTKKFKIDTVMTRGPRSTVATHVIAQAHDGIDSAMPVCRQPVAALVSHVIASEAKQSIAAISQSDRDRIRVACGDIPHSLTPFKDWNISIAELRDDISQNRMRRFGAILRHQQAGFAFNAMVCFGFVKFPELAEGTCAGDILAKNPHVSHCYERPAFEGFPYNLYAMMHAQSAAELERDIKDAAQSIGSPDYVVLHSLRELKKTSFNFFAG